MFTKTILAAAALAAIAVAPQALETRDLIQNGISLNVSDYMLPSFELLSPGGGGIYLNGLSLNGITLNGITLNGKNLNGPGLNVGGHHGVGLNGQVIAIEF